MNTVYVLIMLFGGSTSQSGMMNIQQEFNSYENCEIARKHILKVHPIDSNGDYKKYHSIYVQSQGCFKK